MGHHTEPGVFQGAEEEGETTEHVNVIQAHILPVAFLSVDILIHIHIHCGVKCQ